MVRRWFLVVAAVLAVGCGDDGSESSAESSVDSTTAAPTSAATVAPTIEEADPLEATLTLPSATQYLAIEAGSLWVPNPGQGTVSRVDLATGELLATIAVGDPAAAPGRADPQAVAGADGVVWATDRAGQGLARIDPATNTVVERVPLGIQPYALAVDGRVVWASDFEREVVVRVDTATGEVQQVDDVRTPTGIAVAGGSVWVAEHRRGRVLRIDATTMEMLDALELTGTLETVHAGADLVWVAGNVGHRVTAVDPATGAVSLVLDMGANTFGAVAEDGTLWTASGPKEGCERASFVVEVELAQPDRHTRHPFPCAFGVVAGDGAVWAVNDESPALLVKLR